MSFNLNWFLGVLAIELWLAPYVLMFWPDIRDAWRRHRAERALARYIARYQRQARQRQTRQRQARSGHARPDRNPLRLRSTAAL